MSCGFVYVFAWLALGLPYDNPGEPADEADMPDIELLEFLGGLDDDDAEWQEFFSGMAEQIAAEEDIDEP